MISTRSLHELPDIDQLKPICQSLAILDAIMMPDWEYRYYSFDVNWGDAFDPRPFALICGHETTD